MVATISLSTAKNGAKNSRVMAWRRPACPWVASAASLATVLSPVRWG